MAKKKSFKTGLSNVIEESLNILSSAQADPEEIEQLKQKIAQLEQRIALLEKELYLWRTGKLTLDKFNQSLKQHGLKFNPATNTIERI